jgi:hypothetical protein
VGGTLSSFSWRKYLICFIDLYFWLSRRGFLSKLKYEFKRVRITVFENPLACNRIQVKNIIPDEEYSSGRFKTYFNSAKVNSSHNHLRNRNRNRVDRFPDEITIQTTRPEVFFGIEFESSDHSWKPLKLRYFKISERLASELIRDRFIISIFIFLGRYLLRSRKYAKYPNDFSEKSRWAAFTI